MSKSYTNIESHIGNAQKMDRKPPEWSKEQSRGRSMGTIWRLKLQIQKGGAKSIIQTLAKLWIARISFLLRLMVFFILALIALGNYRPMWYEYRNITGRNIHGCVQISFKMQLKLLTNISKKVY